MTLSRTTSSQLLQSVLLTPASSQIIPPPPPPANYVLLLSTILTPLYKSSAPEEPGYLNLYRWITGSTPSISIEPANEKKIARMKVRELFFKKHT
jgi:hypothetical protein